jgi:uncharacterized membrane protein
MEFHPIPQPEELTTREKEDASGSYLMMFATTALGLPMPVVNLIASVVYYYVNKSKGRFVRFHALQSLYSQLPVTLLNSALVIWAVVNLVNDNPFTNIFWGFAITMGVINIAYFAFSMVGVVRARKGRFFYFVFFGKLSYAQVFRVREEKSQQPVNIPPKFD